MSRNRLLAVLLAMSTALAAPAATNYRFLKTIPLPGDGGQDYLALDQMARRLYVTHGTTVEVVDIDSEQAVGRIEGMNGVHGVALAPKLGHGFITSGNTKTVKMFDLKTLQSLADIPDRLRRARRRCIRANHEPGFRIRTQGCRNERHRCQGWQVTQGNASPRTGRVSGRRWQGIGLGHHRGQESGSQDRCEGNEGSGAMAHRAGLRGTVGLGHRSRQQASVRWLQQREDVRSGCGWRENHSNAADRSSHRCGCLRPLNEADLQRESQFRDGHPPGLRRTATAWRRIWKPCRERTRSRSI